MTGTAAVAKAAGTQDTTTRSAVPAPRRSPEESREESREQSREESSEPVVQPESYGYPGVRYALEHATALRQSDR